MLVGLKLGAASRYAFRSAIRKEKFFSKKRHFKAFLANEHIAPLYNEKLNLKTYDLG